MEGTLTTAQARPVRQTLDVAIRSRHPAWTSLGAALLGGLSIALLAASNGGYWPTAWSWSSLAFIWLATLALVLRRPALGRREVAMLAALFSLLAWIATSTIWSTNVGQTVLETQRLVVYIAGLAAVLLLVRSSSYRALLTGVWGAIALVCGYALLTRLFPERLGFYDPIAGYRLSEPLGYWNGLGIFAAVGSLLALGLAARARSLVLQGTAAASLLLTIPTLYFTFSRGAWIALAVGIAAAFVLDTRRLQFATAVIVLAPFPAVAVWLASRSRGLTRLDSPLTLASHDGHRLAVALLALAVGAGTAAAVLGLAARRLSSSTTVRQSYAVALVASALAGAAILFAHFGSPPTLARRAYDSFTAPPPRSANDLNQRLFTLASTRRVLWTAAWHNVEAHPLLGSGAGTFERVWLRDRTIGSKARDAHSLYLETLSELGPVGLALLVVTLAMPAAAAVAARHRGLVAPAFGAYAAFLVHAGMDWDWEMTAVTLAGLLCGASILLAARSRRRRVHLAAGHRTIGVALALILGAYAFVGLVGNRALSAANAAAGSAHARKEESEARKAVRWAPWSSEAWRLVAEGEYVQGDLRAARASLRRALAKDSGDWRLWFNLAAASRGRERLQALHRAQRLNPLSPEIAAYRASLRERSR